ncbi:MAG: hypothetical protein K5849_01295 [Bacteroidales bacterium]|nr:hypothetical protein [Bacteroidales bacterium]
MRKKAYFSLLAFLCLLSACGGNGGKTETVLQERRIPELIAAVPSDALAVLCYDRCAEGLALYDSTSVLHQLDLSAFKNTPMALSLCYNGSLVPVLALDAGRTEAVDSASAVNGLLGQAAALRLKAEYIRPDLEAKRRGIVIITPSNAQLTAVRRHLTEYTSILDAPLFRQALAAAASDQFIIFRNSGAARLAPKGWMASFFTRRDLTGFLQTFADWTVLTPDADGFTVTPVSGISDSYFNNLMEALPPADVKFGTVLPDTVRLAMALSVTQPEARAVFERYQDASTQLTRYRQRLDDLKKASGKDPLLWEKELDIREVALVHFNGGAVSMVRPARAVQDREPGENPWQGFIPALYGSAFALADDSATASFGGWHIYGSEAAVRAFVEAPRSEEPASKWPGKGCRFVFRNNDKTLAWDKKGIKLTWNSNQ